MVFKLSFIVIVWESRHNRRKKDKVIGECYMGFKSDNDCILFDFDILSAKKNQETPRIIIGKMTIENCSYNDCLYIWSLIPSIFHLMLTSCFLLDITSLFPNKYFGTRLGIKYRTCAFENFLKHFPHYTSTEFLPNISMYYFYIIRLFAWNFFRDNFRIFLMLIKIHR